MAAGKLTAVQLAEDCLARVERREQDVQAWAHLDPQQLLAQGVSSDRPTRRSPVQGIPVAVKDIIDTSDMPTEYGSPIYAGHRPQSDAACVAMLRNAGALVMGKAVTAEFASQHPGKTRNPHNLAHTPGGSSSGSAAAVADFMAPLALGTQTGGSVIRPAAYCGVVGYKPSAGRVTRAGVKSLSESLDTIGGFGRSVRDVALLGAVLTGDMRLNDAPDENAPRIARCRTPQWAQADADIQRAWDQATDSLARDAASFADLVLPAGLPDLVALQKAVMAFEMARSLSHERLMHRERLSVRLLAL